MSRVLEIPAALIKGQIVPEMAADQIADAVMAAGQIVVLKAVFDPQQLKDLRLALKAWGRDTALADTDDFTANYHRQRAMVSRLQQAPHVFHDYNFNALSDMPEELKLKLMELFEPLRGLYNGLTGYAVDFEIPASGPYVHPQIIHYPSGGGFFARHGHNLLPQKLGFIVCLSTFGTDFQSGATVFEIEGDVVDMQHHQQIGDICIWRYDHPHWVSQSDLKDKFDWNSEGGRWVATFAYFDPKG